MFEAKEVLLLLPAVLSLVFSAIVFIQTRIAFKIQELDARLLLLTEKLLDKGVACVAMQLLIAPDRIVLTGCQNDENSEWLCVIRKIQQEKRKYEKHYQWGAGILAVMTIVFVVVVSANI